MFVITSYSIHYTKLYDAFAIKLLDVLDDLDRLMAGAEATEPTMPLHEALVMVDRKLRKELAAAGLERIDSDGAQFDPSIHEAVAAVAPPAPELDHHVAATFQAGYLFKGALIRPARVQVYTVITSYSIHYTKLYDLAATLRPTLDPYTLARGPAE